MKNLTFFYEEVPEKKVIDQFSLTVKKGECVVLEGDNGSGKSTLLQIACGLLFSQKGSYLFDGIPVTRESMKHSAFSKKLHQRIGYVFQNTDNQLFCATVREEVAFGARQMELPEEEIESRVSDLAHLLSISSLLDRPPYHLSGGEKKRVALAAVLSTAPDILLLDEPFAFLDKKSVDWLSEFLVSLKNHHKTLLLVTHNDSLAALLADRKVFLPS
jgi:cobalt/nickel transport system ATP-binding protein